MTPRTHATHTGLVGRGWTAAFVWVPSPDGQEPLGIDAAWSHPDFPDPPGHPGHLLELPSAQGSQLPGNMSWSGETVSMRPVALTAFPASAGSTLHLTVNLEYSVSYPVA
jgi:hypothetical protein